ncbi:unnamed protein product [Peronospora belbahrii]|uniref:Uncharacterized protein n=1 Tax=Peronospora belbahrii TaxID=622444 RepID=A0AAU9L1X2_9STRA|nr:unnamed protein product [Peronospora belbahrii]
MTRQFLMQEASQQQHEVQEDEHVVDHLKPDGAATGAGSVALAPQESITDKLWSNLTPASGPKANSEWTMSTLLQVGAIKGALDDVMYGSSSFSAMDTLIKSSYKAEEVVDADTLYEI